jgi:signal transduction histidine kinase
VRIEWNGREIFATVRYQQRDEEGYRLGVELATSWESLVSEVLAQQALELEVANSALQEQAEVLKRAEAQLVSYSDTLAKKNEELRHALDAVRRASAMKSRFLATVSHELRTPLNGIIGFAQMLYDGVLGAVSGVQQECLDDMLSCADHLLALIGSVLDLSRIESGKMTFEYAPVSLTRLVAETIETLRPTAGSKQIVISFHPDPKADAAQADAPKLKQILYNYLSNAIKFTGTGGRIAVRSSTEDGGFYRIDVEDSGVGIASADLPCLFSEFSQLGDTKRSKVGCGLGLAISKHIAVAQGGRVGAESELGKGSRFYVVLPFAPRAAAAVGETPASADRVTPIPGLDAFPLVSE